MREQRSGFNPLFKKVVHTRDGIVVDDSARAGKFVPVTGGWADASDYLQYVKGINAFIDQARVNPTKPCLAAQYADWSGMDR